MNVASRLGLTLLACRLVACAPSSDDADSSGSHRIAVSLVGMGQLSDGEGFSCAAEGACGTLTVASGAMVELTASAGDFTGWTLREGDAVVREEDAPTLLLSHSGLGGSGRTFNLVATFSGGSGAGGRGGGTTSGGGQRGPGGGGQGGTGGAPPSPCDAELDVTGPVGSLFFSDFTDCPSTSNVPTCDTDNDFNTTCLYVVTPMATFESCVCSFFPGPFECSNSCPSCLRAGDPCSESGASCRYPTSVNSQYDIWTCVGGVWQPSVE